MGDRKPVEKRNTKLTIMEQRNTKLTTMDKLTTMKQRNTKLTTMEQRNTKLTTAHNNALVLFLYNEEPIGRYFGDPWEVGVWGCGNQTLISSGLFL